MMPGNASGLGMGKDDYLTERILGINLSLTRMRERDGFGKAGTITCSKFFFIPKLEGDSEERVSTCGHVNAYYRMHKSCFDYAVPDGGTLLYILAYSQNANSDGNFHK